MKILFVAFFLLALGANASAQKLIVGENQLPGTPQSTWDLSGPGSTSIEGFTDNISVNHGSTINFKIRTSTNNYRIDIYRLGYYQGNGARLVTTIQVTKAQSQPAPITNAATGEVDAGNWAVSASWAVPSSAVSGVYYAHLTDQNNTKNQNEIPFIVRADESHSDIVFQTSDTTWHAYNGWDGTNCSATGTLGTNLYGGNGPGGDSAPGRAYKVSYNRPIATRNGCGTFAGTQDFLFAAEYSAIFWLEQNGYDVSYIAEVDTSRSASLLLNHKLFTSTGHDEYWDTVARANIEAARAAGVSLAFMSGNEVYWKTRWEPSIDGSNTPYRTLVCYKETRHDAPLDPLDAASTWTWTGTWRDLRFSPPADGGRPENALTGTIFTVDSYRSDAITVPYPMTLLRFWRNTSVAATPSGKTATLTQNILGYEWDESPDNGFAPAGLIDLSSTTLSVGTFLQDYGETTGNGTAFHNLTLYKVPTSGAIVFGAGTVFWAWGLSPNDDGPPTPTDPNIQQAMVNLLADMGIQPATLQAGLVAAVKSTDTTPPVSGISAPANGATFATGQPVAISGFASDIGGRVSGVEVSLDGGATWHRATGTTSWSYNWTPAAAGSYTIQSRATDDSLNTETPSAGNGITVTPFGSSLFLASNGPSLLNANDPNDPVELGITFSSSVSGNITGLRFYKDPIDLGLPSLPAHTVHLWNSSGTLLATATFANETVSGWQQVNLPTPVAIAAGTTYIASYHSNGDYSANGNYFTTAQTNGSLTAPVNAGAYTYGSTPAVPKSTFQASNYWVDVVFAATPGTPAITSALTASGTVGSPFSYSITASNNPTSFNATGLAAGLSVNTATGVISGTPTAAGTSSVALSATNANGTGTATLALTINTAGPPPAITSALTASGAVGSPFSYSITASNNPTSFNATGLPTGLSVNAATGVISGTPTAAGTSNVALSAKNAAGTGTATLTLTINTPAPPAITSALTASGTVGSPFSYSITASNNPTSFNATGLPAGLSVNTTTGVISGTPTAAGTPSVMLSATNAAGTGSANLTLNVIAPGSSVFSASTVPANVTINDTTPVELGVKFSASTAGSITALRFYKGPQNTGTHTGNLWSATGTLLASAPYTNETASGWQQVNLPTPVAISAGTTYIASYHTNGFYSGDNNYFATAVTNGPLTFPASASSGGNGVYTYGSTSTFPTSTYNATNYYVDVVFSTAPATSPPAITSALTASGTVGTPFSYTITATNNPTSFNAAGLPAGLSVNTATGVISGTPTAAGTPSVTLSATNAIGTGSATLSLTIVASGGSSLFPASDVPATVNVDDPNSIELGVKFTSSNAGNITALRFYKSSQDTGTHTAELWSATGTMLATATFTNETASGWQQVSLPTPVAITANTTYIASYHSSGFYSANGNFFAAAYTNGPLTAPASASSGGNGVYAYGGTVSFPSNSYNATNYWVDVLFQ